jgi:hypothetical protein
MTTPVKLKSGRGRGRGGYGGNTQESEAVSSLLDPCADQFRKLRPDLEVALKARGEADVSTAAFQ